VGHDHDHHQVLSGRTLGPCLVPCRRAEGPSSLTCWAGAAPTPISAVCPAQSIACMVNGENPITSLDIEAASPKLQRSWTTHKQMVPAGQRCERTKEKVKIQGKDKRYGVDSLSAAIWNSSLCKEWSNRMPGNHTETARQIPGEARGSGREAGLGRPHQGRDGSGAVWCAAAQGGACKSAREGRSRPPPREAAKRPRKMHSKLTSCRRSC